MQPQTQTATFLTNEQMEVLSTDLSHLIKKIEILNNAEKNDYDELRRNIHQDIKNLFNEMRIKEQLKQENFELEDNLVELKKVKSNFELCSNVRFWKILAAIFVSNLFLIPLTMIVTKYAIAIGLI